MALHTVVVSETIPFDYNTKDNGCRVKIDVFIDITFT